MADPTPAISALEPAWKWLASACGVVIGWITMRQVRRIDALEAETVKRAEYDGTIERLSREIRESDGRLEIQIKEAADRQERYMREYTHEANERGARIHERVDKLTNTLIEQSRGQS